MRTTKLWVDGGPAINVGEASVVVRAGTEKAGAHPWHKNWF